MKHIELLTQECYSTYPFTTHFSQTWWTSEYLSKCYLPQFSCINHSSQSHLQHQPVFLIYKLSKRPANLASKYVYISTTNLQVPSKSECHCLPGSTRINKWFVHYILSDPSPILSQYSSQNNIFKILKWLYYIKSWTIISSIVFHFS